MTRNDLSDLHQQGLH